MVNPVISYDRGAVYKPANNGYGLRSARNSVCYPGNCPGTNQKNNQQLGLADKLYK